MELVTFLLILIVLIIYVILIHGSRILPKDFPSGPFAFPFFGTVHSSKDVHFKIEKWRKKYGPIIGGYMGKHPTIFICGNEEVAAAFLKEEFQGRPMDFTFQARSFRQRLGIFFTDGEDWFRTRKFSVKALNSYRNVNCSLENIANEEIDSLIDQHKNADIVQVKSMFKLQSVNVVWYMLAKERYASQDSGFNSFLNEVYLDAREFDTSGVVVNCFPFLRFVPGVNDVFKSTQRLVHNCQNFFRKTIKDHLNSLDEDHPNDFIDEYLVHMNKKIVNGSKKKFSVEDLITICFDIFVAAAETINHLVEFFILYMVLYPEIQDKVQKELDEIIGRRRPALSDRQKLVYINAVVSEVSRCNPIGPIATLHRCTANTTFYGYKIPKDAYVLMSIWGSGHDQRVWKNPEEFNPDRFLNEDGTYNNRNYFPFGSGQRTCMGKNIARDIVFLFTTNFLQHFSVRLPPNSPMPSTKSLHGLTACPQPFIVKMTRR